MDSKRSKVDPNLLQKLLQKLKTYRQLIYQREVLGDESEELSQNLSNLESELKKDSEIIRRIARDWDKNVKYTYPDAAIFLVYNSLAFNVGIRSANDTARHLYTQGNELGGLYFVLGHTSKRLLNSSSETDKYHVDIALEIMKGLLKSKDEKVRERALNVLNKKAAFREHFFKKYPGEEKEVKWSLNLNGEPQATFQTEGPKTSAREFLSELKQKVNDPKYNELGTGMFDKKIAPSNVVQLRKTLEGLEQAKTLSDLKKIYDSVGNILNGIKPSARADELERFYHDQKSEISRIYPTNKEAVATYLKKFDAAVNNPAFNEKGKGILSAKVPAHIAELRKIMADTKMDDVQKFHKVKEVLNEIKVERHPDVRDLYNESQTKFAQSREPSQADMVRVQNDYSPTHNDNL